MDPSIVINAILLCSVNACSMIAGIFLNSVVIISLRRSSQLRKNLGYFMILVLSCFDLALVAINHPMLLSSIISWSVQTHHQGESKLNIWGYLLGYNLAGFSMSALLTMSVERYLALKYPFFHHAAVTKRRLLFFLAFVVVLTVIVSSLKYLNERILGNAEMFYVLFFLFLLIYLNMNMFIIAKSKRKVESSATANDRKTSKRQKIHFKNISTCSIAISCFFICSLPHIIFSGLRSNDALSNKQDIYVFERFATTFFSMNSTLNCLIFFWRNSILRREGIKLVKCFGLGRS